MTDREDQKPRRVPGQSMAGAAIAADPSCWVSRDHADLSERREARCAAAATTLRDALAGDWIPEQPKTQALLHELAELILGKCPKPAPRRKRSAKS